MNKTLKQSTAVNFKTTPILASDGSPATGLTITQGDVFLYKNHGVGAQKNSATAATHDSRGCYSVPFDTTDTDTLGPLLIVIEDAGAIIWWDVWTVVATNIHASYITNTGLLNVNAQTAGGVTIPNAAGRIEVNCTHWNGTAVTTPNTAGTPVVDMGRVGGTTVSATAGLINCNVTQLSGDGTAADNLELFMDGTGYAGGTIKMGVDLVSIRTDTVAASNLEAMYDGNGYAGGTIKLGANVEQWRGTQPNTLTSGRIESLVGAMANDVVTAAAVAPDAIGASELAADAATEIAAAVHAFVAEVQGSYTTQQILSTLLAICAGETENGGNTFLTPNGAATRVAATTNGSNERTAMTLTPSA
jgi:hypothetical protein